jgi:hypothetical protein
MYHNPSPFGGQKRQRLHAPRASSVSTKDKTFILDICNVNSLYSQELCHFSEYELPNNQND